MHLLQAPAKVFVTGTCQGVTCNKIYPGAEGGHGYPGLSKGRHETKTKAAAAIESQQILNQKAYTELTDGTLESLFIKMSSQCPEISTRSKYGGCYSPYVPETLLVDICSTAFH